MNVGSGAKILARAAVVAVIATATGACSTLESLDPFGDDTPSDTAAAPPDQSADNSATPDLSSVPDRPMQTSTPDSQRQVAQSLAADRSQATYSADTLRGDSVAAAPPPAAPSAVDTASIPDTPSTTTSTATTMAAAPPPPAPSADDSSDDSSGTVSVPSSARSNTTMAAAPPPAAAPMPAPTPATPATTTMASNSYTPTYSAPVAGPGDGRPAVPPGPVSGVPGAQAPVMSDAQLGFQPSQAPALDASVSQFVAPSILNRYRQTAGGRAFASNSAVTTTAVPVTNSRRSRAMGGPEQMSGSVVANLDSLSGPPVSTSPAVYAGVNGTPSSVVFFPGDTTVLNAAAKAQVRAAAASFRASGSTGFIRVVGHASSRTGNMPLERHLVVIFEKSQQRANSVAQELIRAGVPADKVLVEAVGDSQPVFYESMPKGEDGNRRAEIFVQS